MAGFSWQQLGFILERQLVEANDLEDSGGGCFARNLVLALFHTAAMDFWHFLLVF